MFRKSIRATFTYSRELYIEGKRNGKLNVAPGVTVKVDVVRMSNKYEEYDTIKVTCAVITNLF